MENVAGKVVVITGASSGLGAETARHLVKAGAKVALGARRKDRLDALVEELGDDQAAAFKVDVTKREEVDAFVKGAIEQFGQIDAMLHNAGVMPLAPLAENRHEEWDQCIDVNLKGVLYGVGAVLPHMNERQSGQNLFVSSVAGHVVNPAGAVYCATKFGVRAIAESLRKEVKGNKLRTTILSPGAVESELPQSVKSDRVKGFVNDLYENTAIPASSFARAVVFAISQPDDVDINEILFRPTAQEM
ncbi:oxidoreductase [Marinicauda pacifica]|jgi:NADP-dependent 3-hydroxy acid dehydrogenase YdfG|uniref:SDR family oxidoreductase n=1 Tax=Marinicauda pacifica TaxID=1133559 RepID=A0A4S2H9S6_9PROT|nr:SDR family oxidoreductase [Marinicauda pacifica]TGY92321.1 SDR family oxidoreductase [Marinicauda pacifica]GGE47901.1 oxidoreductase [Marinicauda pacifica]